MADINQVKVNDTTYDLADTRIAIGTCSTAASTATKVVTITSPSNWTLRTGAMISVKFTNTNTASSPKLNVNNTGAKSIYYNNAVYTSASSYGGYANRYIIYQYDGTNWVFISWGYDSNSDTKVTQTRTSTDADYPVIFAYSSADKNETQTIRKNLNFTYNPSLNSLSTGKKDNTSLGSNSAAIGNGVTASGPSSFATGSNTIAAGECSHAEGMGGIKEPITTSLTGSAPTYTINPTNENIVPNMAISCNGKSSIILSYDHSTGAIETFTNLGTFTEATQAIIYLDGATGAGSHAEGGGTFASGEASHAEGFQTEASGDYSHAEGYNTIAVADFSHAEGQGTAASGDCSHAEGLSTAASDTCSHAEGYSTTASGGSSHAEGDFTTASGSCAHAEGYSTTASSMYSHAEGYSTTVSGMYSHVEGRNTMASGLSQHVQGRFNVEDTESVYAHIVGNGTSNSNRSNAHTLDWDGNAWFAGNVTIGTNNKTLATTDTVTTSAAGLAPKLAGGTEKYLRADGTWVKPPDSNTTYTFATGDSNGQIKVTPSSGSAQNISVKGLGTAAYTASTAYATSAQGTKADNALPKTGGTMTGNIIMDNTATTAQASEPYIQWQSVGGNNPYMGLAHDQTDGTFIICSMEKDTTTYGVKNYKNGLAIGGGSGNLFWKGSQIATADMITDTKNTTGTTNTSSKIYLAGATSQAANPQTYSHDTVYVNTDGHLYSNSKQVVNLSDTQALTNKTYNGYTLGAACAKGVATSVASGNTNLVTSGGVYSTTSTLAPKASPALTGTPTAPTAAAGTNTTQIATTAFVKTALDNRITYGTADLTEGTSALTTGTIYLVYE